jgi:NAD(P)H-dependent FMN reductase
VFVTPEYCYVPPASLINAVQGVTREWADKPTGAVSYRGVSGGLFRARQAMVDGTSSMLDELHEWAAALKTIRTNQAACC